MPTHPFSPLSRGAGFFGLAACALLGAVARPAAAQTTLYQDEFNDSSFNGARQWGVYDASKSLQRTQWGLTPTMGNEGGVGYARLRTDTYNPATNATMIRGTEIYSLNNFKVGTGIEFEMRLRGVQLQRGLDFGPYVYSERGRWPDGYLKEEIDFEMLSNLGSNHLWTNIWNDWNTRYGYNSPGHDQDGNITVAGMNYNNWGIYTARWYPDRVEWWVNGVLVRTSKDVVPDDPMAVHFNIWAADSGWSAAYDPALQLTKDPAKNVSCFLDVDYVRVRTLPLPTKGTWGNGDGLSGAYYSNTALTGTPTLRRTDPRVNFNWESFSPDVTLPVDKISIAWTGQVQAPTTETYKFFVKADDGVRLWVNNQQLINAWKDQSATEYSGSIALQAGVKVPIRLEYYENGGGASVQLSWSSASLAKGVIPQCQLYSGDTTLPVVAITAPAAGSYTGVTLVQGTASDVGANGAHGTIDHINLRLHRLDNNTWWNGSTWGSLAVDASASGMTAWSKALPTLPDASYDIQAFATDVAGNRGASAIVRVVVGNAPPKVAITAPGVGFSYRSLASVTGTSQNGGAAVTKVSATLRRASDNLYWSGSVWAATATNLTATAGSSGNWATWTLALPSLADGHYYLTATATDVRGKASTVASSDFWLDNIAPSVTVTTPVNGARYSALASASGTAKDTGGGVSSVRVVLQRADGQWWTGSAWTSTYTEATAAVTKGATTTWTLPLPTLAAGNYTLRARALDFVGNNTLSPVVSFVIGSAAAAPAMTAPSAKQS